MNNFDWKKLCEVIEVKDGTHDSPKYTTNKSGFPLVTSKNIKDGKLFLDDCNYINELDYEKINQRSKVDINDIIMPMIGTIGNPCLIIEEPTYAIKNVALFKTNGIHPRFLLYWLKSDFIKNKFINDSKGGTQKFVSLTYLRNLPFPSTTILKQKQIAKILDKANELVELRKESITKLDALAKSIFIDMFGDPVSNPKKWEVKEIRDIVKDVKYGTSEKSSEEVKEYAVLRMNNLTYSGHLDLTSLKYMDLEEKDKEKYLVQKGDLLFNRTNSKELVGKTVVYNLDKPIAYAGYLIRVRTINTSTNVYISAFLNSKVGKTVLFNMCKSIVGMANINAQELQNIKLPVPPLDLQNKFAKIIEKIEEQKVLYTQELEKLQINFDALLQKSFQE